MGKHARRYLRSQGPDYRPPPGSLLVHNHVSPPFGRQLDRLGEEGFRAWTQRRDEPPELVWCSCEFAPDVPVHYRPAMSEPDAD